MSYKYRSLGAAAEWQPDTVEGAILRNQARSNALRIWNDAADLRSAAGDLTQIEPYSNDAFSRALRLIQTNASRAVDVPVPRREFASLIQGATAKLTVLQAQVYRLAQAQNIEGVYPIIERLNRTAGELATAAQAVLRQAQPMRKDTQPKATSGLGFIWLIPLVAVGAFVVMSTQLVVLFEAMDKADRDDQWTKDQCLRQFESTGTTCSPQDAARYRAEAQRLSSQSGVESLLRAGGAGLQDGLRSLVPSVDAAVGKVTDVVIGVAIGGAVLVAGLGVYALWPYFTGVRSVGKRFDRATRGRER